jgi:hypothetical protein
MWTLTVIWLACSNAGSFSDPQMVCKKQQTVTQGWKSQELCFEAAKVAYKQRSADFVSWECVDQAPKKENTILPTQRKAPPWPPSPLR